MANLIDREEWTQGVRRIDPGDSVIGGENAPINLCLGGLNNRVVFVKKELDRAIASIGKNKSDGDNIYARKATVINAGAGLTGGGGIGSNVTIALGTPGKCSGSTQNWAGSNTHTHELEQANSQVAGVAKLINNLTSNDANSSLSAAMGKKLADEKLDANQLMFSRPPVKGGGAAINLNLASKQSIISQLGDKYISFGYHQLVLHNTSDNHNIQGLPLQNRSAVQLDIVLMGGYSYIVCRYILARRQFYTSINWNNDTLDLNWVEILTANNGVMLDGNQDIDGAKTFRQLITSGAAAHWGKISFPVKNGSHWFLEANPDSAYSDGSSLKFNIKFEESGRARYIHFPAVGDGNQTVAYQGWVNSRIAALSVNNSLGNRDLDTVVQAGLYGQNSNADATTARHYPVLKSGTLLVAPSAYGVQQLYFPYDSGEIYNRNSRSGGGFEAWVKINVSPSEMTTAITALERKLVDSSPDALNTLRELSAALNNNPNFAAQILQQLGGKADKATTRAGYGITDASQVAVLTGQVDNGGTIPLPAGYSQAQCKWLVSMAHDDTSLAAWDIYEGGSAHNYYFECFANANRVVTARTFHGQQGDSPRVSTARWVSGRANYIIIGVR